MDFNAFRYLYFQFLCRSTDPWMEITEQPMERGHRFRYACEGKSHGVIKGCRSEGKNRTFPSIKVDNITQNISIPNLSSDFKTKIKHKYTCAILR